MCPYSEEWMHNNYKWVDFRMQAGDVIVSAGQGEEITVDAEIEITLASSFLEMHARNTNNGVDAIRTRRSRDIKKYLVR